MSHPIRILAYNWRCLRHPQAGGAEVNLFEQARRWVRDGYAVTVVCADPGREAAPQKDEILDGIQVRRMGGRFTVYLFAAFYLLTHYGQFDRILDVANGIPFFTPLLTRRPVTLLVHHLHDEQWFSEFPWLIAAIGRLVERYVVPLIYRGAPVIAVSPTTRDALLETGFQPDQLRVVYNGVVAAEETPPAPEVRLPFSVLYVGRIKRYKRLEMLVHAIDQLRANYSGIHLDIAGDGDGRPEIQALVDRLGVGGHVRIHGYVTESEKVTLLRSAAVFATPSTREGWGLSVIEANVQGCPAVAFDVPGLRAAIRHGETGLLAQTDSDFVRALGLLVSDTALRAQYAQAAIRWAAHFDWDRCAEQTLRVMAGGSPQFDLVADPRAAVRTTLDLESKRKAA